ncbi:MAG TPA: oxygenase MpaB family protein [Candidatus Dormibacteraeota bacterium]|jgi:uncharacterized protein (DUF2236 family)
MQPTALEPLARTLVRSVPEHPADDGLFGPRSVVWRVHRDRSFLVAGIRSLMLQALHPLPMAGVAEHSDWQRDPFGRLAATSGYVLTVTYGERAAALAAAAWVRHIHTRVHGVDPVTGLAYSAEDPALLLWVHAAMVDSIVEVMRAYGRGLDAAGADTYVAEMVRFASILGVPEEIIPHDVAGLTGYLTSVDLVQATPAAREAMAIVLDPPGLDEDTRELWHDVGRVAVGTLPEWARSLYGWEAPPPAELEREPVRQLIGVLDFAFESEPGVVEARRRIEARIRAAG